MLCKHNVLISCSYPEPIEENRGRQLEVKEESHEQKEATITKSLIVKRIFSQLYMKIKKSLCKLKVWCPDEHLAL